LLQRGFSQRRVYLSRDGIAANRASKQENVWLRTVNSIVFPTSTLLDTHTTPLRLRQQAALDHKLAKILGENYMAILI